MSRLGPILSAASFPLLRQAQGRLLHKTQERGTHSRYGFSASKAGPPPKETWKETWGKLGDRRDVHRFF